VHQFINGRRCAGNSTKTLDNVDPATGQVIASLDLASADDVADAVRAANQALPAWAATTPAARAELLYRVATSIQQHLDEYAAVESRESGKPIRLATEGDLPAVVDTAMFFAGAARHLEGRAAAEYTGDHTSYVRRDPVGVVGAITPWNFPMLMAAWKAFPIIAAGNTVVLKPSEMTPGTTLMLAEAFAASGLPPGVCNVVVGTGAETGEALSNHPDVAMMCFTGSSAVGRGVMQAASQRNARIHLELGGKAPFVVHDDADLEAASHGAVAAALSNGGQDCTAATRAYVHRSLYPAFVARVAQLFERVRLGPTDDPATDLGPLVSRRQQESVSAAVDRARADGATVVTGGEAPGGELAAGSYYRPTLIVDARQNSALVQDEVFGPVLVCLPFDDDDEAIALANDTRYGLAASVWTSNVFRAHRATREIQAGCVWVNDHIPMATEMPHGGVKASGFGKDMSAYAFDEYTVVRHVMFDNTGAAHKPWHRCIFTFDD
jgi:betaine-aldehyde dehydrogenase